MTSQKMCHPVQNHVPMTNCPSKLNHDFQSSAGFTWYPKPVFKSMSEKELKAATIKADALPVKTIDAATKPNPEKDAKLPEPQRDSARLAHKPNDHFQQRLWYVF